MKKLLPLLALTISFSMNAQVQSVGTDNSGSIASAIGYNTSASGSRSTAMEVVQQQVEIIRLQWDITQQQVEIRLQLWELTQLQVIMPR